MKLIHFKFLPALIIGVLVFAGCSKSKDVKTAEEDDPTPKKYELVWSDEFDGSALDLDKWNYAYGSGFGNQEKQFCTDRDKNLKVEGGNLIITALKEKYNNGNTDYDYTSARITSKGKGFIKYGKVEARINLPSGRGTWPAFWMLPEVGSWPKYGEIDIMEHVGSDPTMISHAIHTNDRNGSKGNNWHNKQYLDNVEGEFHTYGLEWVENADDGDDCLIFTIDGKESKRIYQSVDDIDAWPFIREFYVILNLSIGGTWGGYIDDNIFSNPVQMKVDYVRMYQLK